MASSKFDKVFARVRVADLPQNAEVSGRTIKNRPSNQTDYAPGDTRMTVYQFRRQRLYAVLETLESVDFDEIEIDDIRFAS
ncbi:MAG: hypothetical protein AAB490_01935 [Patescibacteria group bacterium]